MLVEEAEEGDGKEGLRDGSRAEEEEQEEAEEEGGDGGGGGGGGGGGPTQSGARSIARIRHV